MEEDCDYHKLERLSYFAEVREQQIIHAKT
jgi:hypothetical protein